MMSIAEIPRIIFSRARSRDADSTTLWSLPHLDHRPFGHTDTIERQLLLFCLGFLLPVCWWVAAFLPLPEQLPAWRRASADVEAGANFSLSREAKQAEMDCEKRFRNARWWRRVNRMMSVVGVLVIAAIVVLGIASTRF